MARWPCKSRCLEVTRRAEGKTPVFFVVLGQRAVARAGFSTVVAVVRQTEVEFSSHGKVGTPPVALVWPGWSALVKAPRRHRCD